MDLTDYYAEVVKTAGLVGPSEEETKEAIAALELAAEGDESIDVDAVEEFLKTAGLITEEEEEEPSEEKIAAVTAVAEQFDIDEISFDSDDEKFTAALAIVDGFEKVAAQKDSDVNAWIKGTRKSESKDATRAKADKAMAEKNMAARRARLGDKDSMKRKFTLGTTKAKHLLGKVDETLHGSNVAKKMGMSVKNWRRAGTAGAALAAGGAGAAYLRSRKNK